MLISDSHQFVFVHIRKAAGTSLRQILGQVAIKKNDRLWNKLLSRNGLAINYRRYSFRKHANLIEAQRSMPSEKFENYFKFAIVRNPWERLVSEYEYIKTQPSHSRFKKLMQMNFSQYINFQSLRSTAHQVNALKLQNGQLGCDFVGKLETLGQSLNLVGTKLGINFSELPHINQVNRRDYRTYYSDTLVESVAQLWDADIKAFNYQFE